MTFQFSEIILGIDRLPIKGVFPLHIQGYWDWLQFHLNPDQDKAFTKDERKNESGTFVNNIHLHKVTYLKYLKPR